MSDRFPFPDNPTGWYRVAFRDDIRPNELTPLSFFGMELIAFRVAHGAVHVMEAHCPHLGAHIGVGGRIEDGRVVCPFHGWKFDTAGRNVQIPYRGDEINRKASLRTFEARDWCGLVMVWFDEGARAPGWQLPAVPEFSDDTYLWHTPTEARWRIRSHPQEILENTVDIVHFQFVHGVSSFGELTYTNDGPMLRTTAELTLNTPQGPVSGAVVNEMWGLGIDINRVVGVGDGATILAVTPVDGERVEVVFAFLSPRASNGEGISRFGQGHVRDTIRQIEADFPIWENKVHRSNPSLAIGEGAILPFRRWSAQFYTAARPTAAELARRCIEYLGAKDLDRLRELFDGDAGWELAYPLDGVQGELQTVRGKRVISKFHTMLMSGIERVEMFDIDVSAVHDDLAFVEFRSRATTVKGQSYGNRYVCRVDARDGKILHWREFFDPRPAEMVRANLAETLAELVIPDGAPTSSSSIPKGPLPHRWPSLRKRT